MTTNLSYTDLKWVKNVKREKGEQWAYDEYVAGTFFELNWSAHYGKNAERPRAGDLILLFQTVKSSVGVRAGTYLTHLVTPISNEVLLGEGTHPNLRSVFVVGRPSVLVSSRGNSFNFSKVSRGLCYNFDLIGTSKGHSKRSKREIKQAIWSLFGEVLQPPHLLSSFDDDTDGVWEGEPKELKFHKYYKRDRSIVAKAKKQAKHLRCEVCEFDFNEKFPELGNGFIECHHKVPIGTGVKRKTMVSDLALVCSNCHRMLHRKCNGKYYTVEELRGLRKP